MEFAFFGKTFSKFIFLWQNFLKFYHFYHSITLIFKNNNRYIRYIKMPRKKYKHTQIQSMLRDPKRNAAPFGYLHPQISPTGQTFHEDADAHGIVADAKERYTNKGWLPTKNISTEASRVHVTALMSMEGALTSAVHNAIQNHPMFDDKDEIIKGQRKATEERATLKADIAGAQPKAEKPAVPVGTFNQPGRPDGGFKGWHVQESARIMGTLADKGSPEYRNLVERVGPDPTQDHRMRAHWHALKKSAKHHKFLNQFMEDTVQKYTAAGAPRMTSQQEATEATQEDVPVEQKQDERPDGLPSKKETIVIGDDAPVSKPRRTKKRILQEEAEKLGVKWKKSWTAAKLLAKIDANTIQQE